MESLLRLRSGRESGVSRLLHALVRRYPPRLPLFDLRHLSRPKRRAANQTRIRRLAVAVPVREGVVLCRVLGRYKMYLDAGDGGHAAHLMLDGFWEMWITELMPHLVRPGMVAVDVGANQGYYTLLLAELVGPEGRVHAAEPNPEMVALLRRSVAVNGFDDRVTLHPQPVGARDGERVFLHASPHFPSGGFVAPHGDGPPLLTRTLDDIVGETRVDLVKIDAEGAEMAVWQGMRRILARGQELTVLMEFVADRCPDPGAFLNEAVRLGFRLARIDGRDGVRPVTPREILDASPSREWMLLLQRGGPR